jgi:UDP-N-acetylmuramyl pentapeptide synthase
MFELGKYAEPMHKKIGLLSAGSDITRLYVTGEFAEKVAEGAKEGNMDYRDIFKGTQKEILTDLTESLGPDDWVLVKGSRAMGMEKIVKGLMDWGNG